MRASCGQMGSGPGPCQCPHDGPRVLAEVRPDPLEMLILHPRDPIPALILPPPGPHHTSLPQCLQA